MKHFSRLAFPDPAYRSAAASFMLRDVPAREEPDEDDDEDEDEIPDEETEDNGNSDGYSE